MAAASSANLTLIVTGDVVVDHHLYEGERPRPTTDGRRGVHVVREVGGAAILKRLIEQLLLTGDKQTRAANLRALEARYRAWAKGDKLPDKPQRPWEPAWHVKLGVTTPQENEPTGSNHAYAVLRPHSRLPSGPDQPNAGGEQVWRIAERMGYGEPDEVSTPTPPQPIKHLPHANVLVLDDGGLEFRKRLQADCWHLSAAPPLVQPPRWILLKMSGPIARGDLWSELIVHHANRLVCLISSDDLRHEKLSLGRGLSWERTIEELCFALGSLPEFADLQGCAHLIVTFSADGALWIDRTDPAKPVATLIFDAGGADGEFIANMPGEMVGLQTAIAAALARALAQHATVVDPPGTGTKLELDDAIKRGLHAMRDLMALGHGVVGKDPGKQRPGGYPIERIRDVLLKPVVPPKDGGFAPAIIPQSMFQKPQWAGAARWMIIKMLQRPLDARGRPSLFGVACDLLIRGTKTVLPHFPHADFGLLTTVDRKEIEALRNIRNLMRSYKKDMSATKPLSLGVFGPPGAGKSFGVKQIAKQVFENQVPHKGFEETAWLEFNLSQFTPPTDLIGALHQVRDRVLTGVIPVVFWDEFDSRAFEWLQYLLAPMQDGRFQEGQISHPVGKCVFIFAGGTSASFAAFEQQGSAGDEASIQFKLRKGPDFRSRLDAYYDVLGPNQRELPVEETFPDLGGLDPDDQGYVLRRALLIHSVLKTGGKPLADLDEGLINALLRVPRYKNGARSMEKLVLPMTPARNEPVRRSWLPTHSQLAMHVDSPDGFAKLLAMQPDTDWLLAMKPAATPVKDLAVSHRLDPLAPAIHQTWRDLAATEDWKMAPRYDKDFDKLDLVDQEDNRAAARRIPWILGLAGMALVKRTPASQPDPTDPSEADVKQQLEHHMERLAEAEHDGWMDYRLKTGWKRGEPRDDDQLIHPALVKVQRTPGERKEKGPQHDPAFPRLRAPGWLPDRLAEVRRIGVSRPATRRRNAGPGSRVTMACTIRREPCTDARSSWPPPRPASRRWLVRPRHFPPRIRDNSPRVPELFTSEGCSSCPPADALLGQFAHQPGVIALAWHVDYWNGLGWHDPFSSPLATQRQRTYAAQLRDEVYTPALVVNGAHMVVGSDADAIRTAIGATRAPEVAVSLRRSEDGAVAETGPAGRPVTALLVTYDPEHHTSVRGGENGGRRLLEYRIVREATLLGTWDGAVRRLTLPAIAPGQGAVLLLQTDDLRVCGAADMPAA